MLRLLITALLAPLISALSYNNSAQYANGTLGPSPHQTFQSLSSTPIAWNFVKYPENGMKPGKFFLTPWGKDVKRNGPYIFDEAGELVWDGTAPPYNYGHAMSFTPFKYQGQDVLALWQGKFSPAGYGDGFGLILDTSYNVVANISATVPGAMMDFHEFSLTDNGTALISVYSTEPYNMTAEFGAAAVNSSEKIMLSYAQEIDIASGEALFTWRSLDHQDPHGCYASPADTNTTKETAWDYFHINAIEKDNLGNYLISSRHCHTIYYVNGTDGDVIWRLGGKNSSYALGPGAEFDWQHYAHFRPNNTISLFDNGAGPGHVDHTSGRAIVLQLDHDKRTADLIYEALPVNHTWSVSQGSISPQADGSWLVGWGARPWISEYSSSGPALTNGSGVTNDTTSIPGAVSGELEWAAQFGVGDVESYRNLRANWTAYPSTNPDFVVVKSNQTNERTAFISWNGATEVAAWEIHASNNTTGSDSVSVLNVTRSGFETSALLPNTSLPVLQARALSSNGTILGFSEFVNLANGTESAPPTSAQSSQVFHPPAASFTTGANSTDNARSSAMAHSRVSTIAVVISLGIALIA